MPRKINTRFLLLEEAKQLQKFLHKHPELQELARSWGNSSLFIHIKEISEGLQKYARAKIGDDTLREPHSGSLGVPPAFQELREFLHRYEQQAQEPERHVEERPKKRGKSAGRKKIEIPHSDEVIELLLDEQEKKPRAKQSPKADAQWVMNKLKRPPYRAPVPDDRQRTVERRIEAARKARTTSQSKSG
jgi:hypothetical protein